MISFVLASLAAAAVQGPSAAPRRDFATCLGQFTKSNVDKKLDGTAFTAAAKTACAAEEAAFRKSLVDYDVKAGAKRAAAEEGAKLQVDDYLINAADTYQTYTAEGGQPPQ
jgi:hypothetical protein